MSCCRNPFPIPKWLSIELVQLRHFVLVRQPKTQVFTFRLPPGPYGFPFLGVAHQITPGNLTKMLGSWRDQYGDIYSFCLAGQNIVVVCIHV